MDHEEQPKSAEELEYIYCLGLADSFMAGGDSVFDFEEEFEESRTNLAGLIKLARAEAENVGFERCKAAVLEDLKNLYNMFLDHPDCARMFSLVSLRINAPDFGVRK